MVLLAFSKRGGSKRAGVNDSLRGCQSRDDRAGGEPARIEPPRFHQKGKKHRMVLLAFSRRGGSKRAGVNDSLRGCQSRDDRAGGEPARIEPPRFHQKWEKHQMVLLIFQQKDEKKRCLIKLKKQNL